MSAIQVFAQQKSNVIAENVGNSQTAGSSIQDTVKIATKYGLQVVIKTAEAGPDTYTIDLIKQKKTLPEPEKEQPPSEDEQKPIPPDASHYRIFPDWQTSYFWKHPKHLKDPDEDTDVEDEDIEKWYPGLAPFFFDWRELYEDYFVGQEIDLGAPNEVFKSTDGRVAWTVEGFLMCCWLTLQPAVSSVEYLPEDKTYILVKASLSEKASEFFSEMNTQLERAKA
ncbi:unnamed protein product [Clonostachys rosea]|uniref:Uncharacterized protein n=1 Tax=Bionectria ochroleuca TaxID=29856 RepID=A0ABY6UKX1_BIOOC|nr:unnamed protein product [Clonostachys rosea]